MTDERAVSSTLSYTLTLAITAILISGLLIAAGAFVSDQRETVVRSELRVIGQQVATDIEHADRLVRAADTSGDVTVQIDDRFPERIAGTTYDIELVPNSPGPAELVLDAVDPDVTITVSVDVQTDVRNSNAGSGAITVRYDTGGSELVVEDA